jgi:FMN phosphatase YigB (HAD superfamily)
MHQAAMVNPDACCVRSRSRHTAPSSYAFSIRLLLFEKVRFSASRFSRGRWGEKSAYQMFGFTPKMPFLAKLELDLYAELASIKLYDDASFTLKALKNAGYKIGICSNLAAPYAVPVKLLLPFKMDFYVWSFESGAVKPYPRIFEIYAMD